MKKYFVMLLSLLTLILLCACGNSVSEKDSVENNTSEATVEQEDKEKTKDEYAIFQIGDSWISGDLEITITDFQFADSLNNTVGSEEDGINMDYLLPIPLEKSTNNIHEAKEGRTKASMTFTVKNLGKTSTGVGFSFVVDYNGGYIFYPVMTTIAQPEASAPYWWPDLSPFNSQMEPLSEAITCRVCFDLPTEVRDNEDAPLLIKMMNATDLPDSEYYEKVKFFWVVR